MTSHPTQDKPIRAGIFRSAHQADEAVSRLLEAGFTKEQISVLCSEKAKEEHFKEFVHEHPAGSDAAEGAAAGSAIGAVLGGLTSAGVATAAGLSVLLAGPSFLIGGAVAGGLIGAMTTRGEEGELADFYDQAVTAGMILVAAHDRSENNAARLVKAEQVFKEVGSEPIPLSEG